ncbi:hypothetical protein BDW66DRAFT_154669 [Aspergillus desertorum]
MPVTYALNMFGLSFATLVALLVWVIVEHREVLTNAAKRIAQLAREALPGRGRIKVQRTADSSGNDVPMWWYLICSVLALSLAILAVDCPGFLRTVYATTNLKINIDILCCIISGLVFEGKVLANIWFFDLVYITTIKGLYFAQDMSWPTIAMYTPTSSAIQPIN